MQNKNMQVQTGVMMAPHQTVMVQQQQGEPWGMGPLITAIIGFFCCPLLGFIGTVCGLMSYTDHKMGDQVNWRSRKNCALGLGIAAIIIGIIIIIAYIAVVAIAAAAVANRCYGYGC